MTAVACAEVDAALGSRLRRENGNAMAILAALAAAPRTEVGLQIAVAGGAVTIERVLAALVRSGAVERVRLKGVEHFALTKIGRQMHGGAAGASRRKSVPRSKPSHSLEQRVWTALRMLRVGNATRIVESFLAATDKKSFKDKAWRAGGYLRSLVPAGIVAVGGTRARPIFRLVRDLGPHAPRPRHRSGTIYDPNRRVVIWPERGDARKKAAAKRGVGA